MINVPVASRVTGVGIPAEVPEKVPPVTVIATCASLGAGLVKTVPKPIPAERERATS